MPTLVAVTSCVDVTNGDCRGKMSADSEGLILLTPASMFCWPT